ncbi:C4-dicarboxylate ABC transporter substrate-binding protein [Roseibium aquae]|uniref:TRAP transporter small permease protein n=1 Tax=Roseibium aquae TaxID=1323746 RepID=A0A916WT22_9HYPH|nr:TRAP transporter small permease subunit [Roseibium aquae]GGB32070.1 C4-dicarboxylate ABC transporter substrate-binding protein [Roseibium aquae]
MTVLGHVSKAAERLNAAIGFVCGWLLLIMIGVQCAVVVLRYALNAGYVWMQEVVVYLHASAALLACAYALSKGAHVRVDIIYRHVEPGTRRVINLFGTVLFLLPLVGIIAATGWPFAASSWAVWERSAQPAGLPAVFLLKTLIPVFAILLGIQAVACLLLPGDRFPHDRPTNPDPTQ